MKEHIKLGVNIDHVATLREARHESFPDVVEAAREAVAGGADGIVVHLREDRRHIQDKDVYAIRRQVKTRLDLEMAMTREIQRIALDVVPDMITLVPERREEITTEGGLNVKDKVPELKGFVKPFIDRGISVSLFVDPVMEQIECCARTGANFIEIHTGAYANAGNKDDRSRRLREVIDAVQHATKLGLKVNAGHGLDYNNVADIAGIAGVEELNIGFSIIARAVFVGLKQAVSEMKMAIKL